MVIDNAIDQNLVIRKPRCQRSQPCRRSIAELDLHRNTAAFRVFRATTRSATISEAPEVSVLDLIERSYGTYSGRLGHGHHAGAQQIKVGAAIHLTLDHLQPIDLPLDLTVGPFQRDGVLEAGPLLT